jgi:hypothetical protein
MRTHISLAAALLVTALSAHAVDSPNPKLTPGAVRTTNPYDVCSTADHRVSTKDVRNVSKSTSTAVYQSYGMSGPHQGYCVKPGAGTGDHDNGCEVDHLISLELGGSNDQTNLWPQPYFGEWNARKKDRVENRLHAMVCSGLISLPEAQQMISKDWKGTYNRYVLPNLSK